MMSLCLPGPGPWRACVLLCSPALSSLGRGVPACSSAALLCPAWPWAVACLCAPLQPCSVLPGPGPWRACVILCSPALSSLGRGVPACSSAALLCPLWALACLRAPLRPCSVPRGPGPWRACVLLCGPALSRLALGRGAPARSSALSRAAFARSRRSSGAHGAGRCLREIHVMQEII